jgi:hypothetical protein
MRELTLLVEDSESGKYKVLLLSGVPGHKDALVLASEFRERFDAAELQRRIIDDPGNMTALGDILGRFLLAGSLGIAFEAECALGRNSARTYLHLIPPELDCAPWECARWKGRLFLQSMKPFVRYARLTARTSAPEWGLRILIVLAAEDADARLGCAQEIAAIRTAVRPVNRLVDCDLIVWPTRPELEKRVKEYKPHVLHLIGHGDESGLRLYDRVDQDYAPWTSDEVRGDLQSWGYTPELIYLNTCRTGAGPWDEASSTLQAGVVGVFFEEGAAAVIAMHADVRGELAGLCAGEFYRSLGEGASVDVAITRGRQKIAQHRRVGEGRRDPYLAKLVVRQAVENILARHAQLPVPACPALEQTLNEFVDRDQERRKLVELLDAAQRAIIVQGPAEAGKSWLLQWCADACRQRNMGVQYVELGGCQNWLKVLRAIRDGDPQRQGPVFGGLNPAAAARLNWRLNALARGEIKPAPESFTGNEVEEKDFNAILLDSANAPPDAYIHAMDALQDALLEQARGRPLLLALDNFSAGDQGLAKMHFDILRDHWIDRLVLRSESPVRVALGLKTEHIHEYGLELRPEFQIVEVKLFEPDEFKRLLVDMMPLLHPVDKHETRRQEWLQTTITPFDVTSQGALTARALKKQCDWFWEFCRGYRSQWEVGP